MKLIQSIKLALLSGAALATSCAPRSDINDNSDVGRAAKCIQGNLFPGSTYIRVSNDGYTVSVSRMTPGYNTETRDNMNKVEFSLFVARGISDEDAGANGVLALGDDNDRTAIAVMENCVVENMKTNINTQLLPPLPAPEGYRSLQSMLSTPKAG